MTNKIELPVGVEEGGHIGLLIEGNGTAKLTGKEVLRLGLIEGYGEEGFNLMLSSHPFLTIDFKDCGGFGAYETWEDVPEVDVPCPCGNPGHWLIKYEMS